MNFNYILIDSDISVLPCNFNNMMMIIEANNNNNHKNNSLCNVTDIPAGIM